MRDRHYRLCFESVKILAHVVPLTLYHTPRYTLTSKEIVHRSERKTLFTTSNGTNKHYA
jgi:hypothetical protein